MTQTCPTCGHSIATNDNFCEKCWTPLHKYSESVREEFNEKKVNFFYTEEQRMNRMAFLFNSYLLVVWVLWAAVIFLIYIFSLS